MSITEEYTLFQLAVHFMEKEDFKILHMNEKADELWLIKLKKNKSEIIRLMKNSFNWQNELKKDITNVFRKIQLMKKSFNAKNIEIYNIYISTEEPVDDWDAFKNPIRLEQKDPMKMNVFYLSLYNFKSEKSRLLNELNSSIVDAEPDLSKQEKTAFVKLYKTRIFNKLTKRNEAEQQKLHTYGKARINYLFVSINIIFYFMLNIVGKDYFKKLYELAVFNKSGIVGGEWWRLISSLFIHSSVLHVVLTVLVLYYLGTLIERAFGSLRFVIIFFTVGIGTNLSSFAFSANDLIIGATGILFGLLGALLVFALYYRRLYLDSIGKNIIAGFVILLLLSVIFPQLEIFPYVTGFIIGFIAANVTYLPNKRARLRQYSSGVLLLLLFVLLIMIGLY